MVNVKIFTCANTDIVAALDTCVSAVNKFIKDESIKKDDILEFKTSDTGFNVKIVMSYWKR